ncbi:hypothetical protein AB0G05_45115 [Nonomuraea wenchangensis]
MVLSSCSAVRAARSCALLGAGLRELRAAHVGLCLPYVGVGLLLGILDQLAGVRDLPLGLLPHGPDLGIGFGPGISDGGLGLLLGGADLLGGVPLRLLDLLVGEALRLGHSRGRVPLGCLDRFGGAPLGGLLALLGLGGAFVCRVGAGEGVGRDRLGGRCCCSARRRAWSSRVSSART